MSELTDERLEKYLTNGPATPHERQCIRELFQELQNRMDYWKERATLYQSYWTAASVDPDPNMGPPSLIQAQHERILELEKRHDAS